MRLVDCCRRMVVSRDCLRVEAVQGNEGRVGDFRPERGVELCWAGLLGKRGSKVLQLGWAAAQRALAGVHEQL